MKGTKSSEVGTESKSPEVDVCLWLQHALFEGNFATRGNEASMDKNGHESGQLEKEGTLSFL